LIALTRRRRVVRVVQDRIELHADLSGIGPGINDMVSRPDGSTYVGCGQHGDPACYIALVAPDGEVRIAASDIPRPNGMVLTPDETTLLYSATDAQAIMRMRIGPDGMLSDAQTFADLGDASPDGLCLDASGSVWAPVLEKGFIRVQEGGRVTERIDVGDGLAITCVLGGDDRRTLLLGRTMATLDEVRGGRDLTNLGFLDVTSVETPGAGWP
jgi:sugar lactone lactonase YvrE